MTELTPTEKFKKLSWLRRATDATGLSPAERAVLLEIALRSDEHGRRAFAATDTMAEALDLKERWVQVQLRKLEEAGAIVCVGKARNGTRSYSLVRAFGAPTTEVAHDSAEAAHHSARPTHDSAPNPVSYPVSDQVTPTGPPRGGPHPAQQLSETFPAPIAGVCDLEATDTPSPLPRRWQPNRANWAVLLMLRSLGREVDADCAFVAFDRWARTPTWTGQTKVSANWGARLTSVIRLCAGVDPTEHDPHLRAGFDMTEDYGAGDEVLTLYEELCEQRRRGLFRPLPTPSPVTTR